MTDDYKPPPGPPPSYTARQQAATENGHHVSFAPSRHPGHPSEHNTQSAPPKSLNPFRRTHSPRQELSPSRPQQEETYLPPSGPPPSWQRHQANDEKYEPPPGPPPSKAQQDAEPPAYASWMSVPDTSQLPPPPTVGYEESPTANASGDSANRGRAWCRANPLYVPGTLSSDQLALVSAGSIPLSAPPGFHGGIEFRGRGTWIVRTRQRNHPDCAIVAGLPSYSAAFDNLHRTGHPKTIYYEVRVIRMGGGDGHGSEEADAGIVLGFVAPPYPPFRLPGWERASLGVHGDDGRRYVDDNRGGKDFTTSFKPGEVVGIGMTFSGPRFSGQRASVDVFFTREGRRVGGWDLFEERDRDEEGSVEGLDGGRDLLAAVGLFGAVEFEVRFKRDEWLYRP